jgi:hypothetical protein
MISDSEVKSAIEKLVKIASYSVAGTPPTLYTQEAAALVTAILVKLLTKNEN